MFAPTRTWLLTTIIVTIASLLSAYASFGRSFPDSDAYRQYALFILHQTANVNYVVAMRPILPAIAAWLSLLGTSVDQAFALVNTVFLVMGAIVAQEIAWRIFGKPASAMLAGIMFATSPTILWFGATVLVDTPGYFFTGLAVLLALIVPKSKKRQLLMDLAVMIGFLFKESVAFSILFYLIVRTHQRKWKVTILSLVLVICAELILLSEFSLDPLVFFRKYYVAQSAATIAETANWSIFNFIQTTINAFVPYFPRILRYTTYPALALIGFLSVKHKLKVWLLSCFAILAINGFIWPVMTQRYSFNTWPVIIPILAYGMDSFFEKAFSRIGLPSRLRLIPIYAIIIAGGLLTNGQIQATCGRGC